MLSNKLLRICSRRFLRKSLLYQNRLSSGVSGRSTAELFFMDNVQDLLKRLTRIDLEKVYAPRKEAVKFDPPSYKFMTTEELEKAKCDAKERAAEKVQMPPVLDERKEIDQVFVKDENLVGFSKNKFIFTDITYGVDDRLRNIIVRDEDGTLRQAKWEERDRMNQIYFPKPGRKIIPSRMFKQDNLKSLLDRGEYTFILDSACCQFEPDDPSYINICRQTYDAVDSDCAYNNLRSTRHYGPFIFYLATNKNIDNLLMENIATDRIEDATWLISLYNLLNPDSKCGTDTPQAGKQLDYLQSYIVKESKNREKLELTLQTYREYLEAPKSQAEEI